MNANELMLLVMCGWAAWFFFGGGWAVIRAGVGVFGYKDGENMWSGFKSLGWWLLVNLVVTAWYIIEFGGTV